MSNLQGTELDLQGTAKPRVYGSVSNALPKLVNANRQIYQVGDQSTVTISAVYDGGAPITAGTPYPDLLTLRTTAPSAGQYRAFQGYFRLGALPVKEVTCDAADNVTDLGDVFNRIAVAAGFTVNAADVTAANAAGDVGLYITEQTPTADLLDLLANSYGGYYGIAGSEIQLKQLTAPASPTFTIEDYEDLEVSRDATGAGENGLPVWRVVVKGDRVEHVQTDVNGAANPARLKTEYREAVWESPAVQVRHPLSPQLTLVTCLRNLSDMQALANRIGALFSVRRDTVRVRASFSPSNVAKLSAALRIGAVCRLTSSYLGYEAGRDMTVIAYEFDVQRTVANFTLWG